MRLQRQLQPVDAVDQEVEKPDRRQSILVVTGAQ